jgi:uncharacterized protein with PIN domain
MRLWRIQQLFDSIHKRMPNAKKYVRLIHVCSKCEKRTPEFAPLDIMEKEVTQRILQNYEIRNNSFCDKCNKKFWKDKKIK